MKTITYFSSFFLMTFLCFSATLKANEMTPATVMIDGRKIVRANWPAAYMGANSEVITTETPILIYDDPIGHHPFEPNINLNTHHHTEIVTTTSIVSTPCIQPDQNNHIEIELSYPIQNTIDLSTAPDIYLRYTAGNTTGILTESDMNQATFSSTVTIFYKTVTIDLGNLGSNEFQYTFDLLTTNTTGGYTQYPINNYYNVFVDTSGPLQLPSPSQTVLTGQKDLCFLGLGWSSPLLADNSSKNMEYQTKNSSNNNYLPKQSTIKAYPNPFTNQLILKGNMPENSTIQLFDIQGKLILSKKTTTFDQDSPQMINTAQLLPGIYYCKIQTSTSTQTIKVVKQ